MTAGRDTTVSLPEDVRWSCLQCGRSCEDWSEVWVDSDTAERIARLPLFNPRLDTRGSDFLPFAASSREPDELVIRTRDDGHGGTRCVLLDDDQRCAIHAAHGEAAKPGSCRGFPFVFVATPGGTRAALSFACTAVLHHHGERITDQAEVVRETERVATHRERRGVGLRVAPGAVLRWPEYEALERELLSALGTAADVASGLFEQARIVREWSHLGRPDTCASPQLRRFTLAWLLGQVGRPPRFRAPVPGLMAPDPERLLRRWVEHRIWRRDLLRGGEVLFAHGLLLAEVALARQWAAESAGGMAEAVAQIERGLALHSDLVERIDRNLEVRDRAGRLFAAPRYAASLTAGVFD